VCWQFTEFPHAKIQGIDLKSFGSPGKIRTCNPSVNSCGERNSTVGERSVAIVCERLQLCHFPATMAAILTHAPLRGTDLHHQWFATACDGF
jgi:hypothetical protein